MSHLALKLGGLTTCLLFIFGAACSDDTTTGVTSTASGGNAGHGAQGGQGGAAGPICGNGLVEEGEECDDGNNIDDYACAADCTDSTIGCYNGIVEYGEACFDGSVERFPVPRIGVVDMVIFDCDDDGDNDVVTLSTIEMGDLHLLYPYLATMINDGNGALSTKTFSDINLTLGVPIALVYGNFDNTPGQDLAYITYNTFEIYSSTGNCHWGPLPTVIYNLPDTVPPFGDATNFLTMNLDGDGIDDIAVLGGDGGASLVYHLSTTASLSSPISTDVGVVSGVAAGDVDGDGYDDLILGSALNDRIAVLRWSGTSFEPKKLFPLPPDLTGAGTIDVAVAEADNDGRVDIITANRTDNSITMLRNIMDGALFNDDRDDASVKGTQPVEGRRPVALTLGDFDGDGIANALVCNEGEDGHPPTVALMFNDGGGQYYLMTQQSLPLTLKSFPLEVDLVDHTLVPTAPHLVDMNQDGALDIVVLLGDSTVATLTAHP